MAIAFQSAGQTTGSGSTNTVSLTISAGDIIVVGVSVRTTESTPTITATWNGSESLTASPSSVLDGGAIVTSLLYITNPTSGTHDIDITLSLPRDHGVIALVYSGVDSVDTGSEQTSTSSGSTSSVTVTSATGNMVVDVLGVRDPTSSVAVTGSATERGTSQDFFSGESSISMSELAGAASTVMSWGTWTGGSQLAHIGLELVEAAAGGVSVASPAGAFTLTGNVPAVAAGASAAAPAGTFALTGNAPVVGTGANLASPAGTFALAGGVPAVAGGASAAAPAGALTLTGNAPTVSAGNGIDVPQGALTLTANVPAVAGGASAASPAGALTLTGNAPTVTTTVQVAAPAGTFALAGNIPSVAAGASIAAAAGAFALNGFAPTIVAVSGSDDQLAVSEFRMVALTHNGGNVLAPEAPALAEQRVTIGATSAQSSAFGEYARFIRIVAPATCFVAFGEDPTATEADSMRLVANTPELFGISPGHKLAVIQQT